MSNFSIFVVVVVVPLLILANIAVTVIALKDIYTLLERVIRLQQLMVKEELRRKHAATERAPS